MGSKHRHLSADDIVWITCQRRQGVRVAEIARMMGRKYDTVQRWCRRAGLPVKESTPPRLRQQIRDLRANGYSGRRIARMLAVTQWTVRKSLAAILLLACCGCRGPVPPEPPLAATIPEATTAETPAEPPMIARDVLALGEYLEFTGYAKPQAVVAVQLFDGSGQLLDDLATAANESGVWWLRCLSHPRGQRYRVQVNLVRFELIPTANYLTLDPGRNWK